MVSERQTQQSVPVRCHREGSTVSHSGWLYFTNYRILMVNKLDRDSEERDEVRIVQKKILLCRQLPLTDL